MQFNLTIKLGNDAMQTKSDIADALAYLAEYDLTRHGNGLHADTDPTEPDSGRIFDLNGNMVGSWKISD